MWEIELVVPSEVHEAAVVDFLREHEEAGEKQIHGGALIETMSYPDWLEWGRRTLQWECSLAGDEVPRETQNLEEDRWVPSDTFFAFRKSDGRLVGMIDFRRRIDDILLTFSGQVGYGVRPSERGKGYGGQMLGLALAEGRKSGLEEPVMISCYKENEPSRRTILGQGGRMEREFINLANGKWVQVYMV